jgi:hypothetical protein
MPVDIEIHTGAGDTTIVVWNDQRFQEFVDTLTLASAPTGVSFDPDNWILDEHWQVPYGIAEKTHAGAAHIWALTAAPNPFRGSVVIAATGGDWGRDQCIEIFDICGRRTRRIFPETEGTQVLWRGLDDHGQPAPGGLYFVRAVGTQSTLKLLKM